MRNYSREELKQFNDCIKGLRSHNAAQEMKNYIQHGKTNTYDHCMSVAKASMRLDKFLNSKSDKESLLKGAFLHDLYLYDWHDKNSHKKLHGYHHADSAIRNAKKHFGLSEKEEDIIFSHMWPLNLPRIPKRREAWIVCMADKYVSIKETLNRR